MKRVRQSGTAVELEVRRILRSAGVRCTLNNKTLPGTPDFASKSDKWAIFVHGCFWHGHSGCPRATIPKSNVRFWKTKFADNRSRDRKKVHQLRRLGFSVLTVWQCELDRPTLVAAKLLAFVRKVARTQAITERAPGNCDNPTQIGRRERFELVDSSATVCRVVISRDGAETRSYLHVDSGQRYGTRNLCTTRLTLRSQNPLQVAQDGPQIRFVDLFAGCGGLSLGAR